MKQDERIFLYDGTIEGLITLIYESLKHKIIPKKIISISEYTPSLFDKTKVIKTSEKKYTYTFNKIKNVMSSYSLYQIYKVYLSSNKEKENIILKYVIDGFRYGKSVDKYKTIDSVRKMYEISKYVSNEAHKLKGFIRFKELKNKVLYAEIGPNNNVLEIVSQHFKKRLSNESWIIRDDKRNIMSIYNKGNLMILDSQELDFNNLKTSENEEEIKTLWKQFIKNVTIKERTNLKCQMNFMPKRYWKYICEMEDLYEKSN